MTDYVLDALKLRRDDLDRKLKARGGQPGYAVNVEEIKAALEQLNAEIATREAAAE